MSAKKIHDRIHTSILLHALRLELSGFKRSHSPSAYSIVKKEYGFKGSKQKAYEQLEKFYKTIVLDIEVED